MMRHLIVFLIFIFSLGPAIIAQDYPVSDLSDSLKRNAHLVVREYIRKVEVITASKANETVKKVFTVLDKEGESLATFLIPYDKNTYVNISRIILYDGSGKLIKSVKEKEVEDSPAYSSFELYSEERIKYYKPDQAIFPYTIVYEYDLKLSNLISYGSWRPYSNYNISTQHAQFIIIHPVSININFKEFNIQKRSFDNKNGVITETWELNNLQAIVDEPFSVSIAERIPCVYIMPEKLSYYKYEGSAKTWKDYGKWVSLLYENRDLLPESEKLKVSGLLNGVGDTLEQIKILYNYLQGTTRYVAVTLGAGGFQPFDAATVVTTGYGECKALTNYMFSLLKFKGIRSYPALVASGTYKIRIFKDFPNFQQFDHVILCVPYKKDTIWLECTNQKIPFGFLGDFTDNRDVLLITEKGGLFAHTSKYRGEDNIRTSKAEIIINQDGSANCSVLTSFKGLQYDNLSGFISMNYDEQKKWLYSNSTMPSIQIVSFSSNLMKDKLPVLAMSEELKSKNYCSFSGKNIILPLNLVNAQKPVQKMLKSRFSDVVINRSFIDLDTISFIIPLNLKIESVPSNKNIDSVFGSYSYSVSVDGNRILYTRRLSVNEGHYDSKEYSNLYNFILSVSKADNLKLLLQTDK
jgi:hypothetical protein